MVGRWSGLRVQQVIFASILAAQGVVSAPAIAQEPAAEPAGAGEAICMSRTPEASFQSARTPQPIDVLATAAEAEALAKKGFVMADCEAVGLTVAADRGEWRDEICTLASQGNVAVQNQLEAALGERPAVLCAMAEELAGQWQRTASDG